MGSRLVAVVLAALVAALLGAGTAAAHGGAPLGVVSVAQTLGARELTVTLYPPQDGAGDMPVRVSVQGPDVGGPVRVQAVPMGGPGAGRVLADTTLVFGQARFATASVPIDRAGPWEIVVQDGADVGRIPLTVPTTTTPGWVWAVRGGIVVAVVGLVGAAFTARRRPRVAVGLGGGVVAGVAVIVTAAVLSTGIPEQPAPTGTTASSAPGTDMSGSDHTGTDHSGMDGMDTGPAPTAGHGSGAVVVTTTAVRAAPGGPAELRLDLTDGSTGAPVDDLVVHDDAFIHLAVVGPDGTLAHVHPVRTGPGRYTVRVPVTAPGAHGVFAEMERADGGHQVARSAFVAEGPAGEPAAQGPPAGPGPRDVAGMRVDVTAGPAVAGRPGRVDLVFSRDGQPVRDLQTWLGMAGHLIVLGPAAPGSAAPDPAAPDPAAPDPAAPDPADPRVSFAHVHDMGPAGGPGVGFSYAFPAPGRYRLWAQVQRDWQLVTVPITLDVAPAPAPTGM